MGSGSIFLVFDRKTLRFQGLDFLFNNFLFVVWGVAQTRAKLWPETCSGWMCICEGCMNLFAEVWIIIHCVHYGHILVSSDLFRVRLELSWTVVATL